MIRLFMIYYSFTVCYNPMKKLPHPNSDAPRTVQTTYNSEESADTPNSSNTTAVKNMEGKVLLLEERNKAILTFYQQKVQQLRQVLQKQQDTKQDLTQELASLSIQNQQQNQYVDQLKKLVPTPVRNNPEKLEKMSNNRGGSRSKGKQLFFSKNLSKSPAAPALKKCRSS